MRMDRYKENDEKANNQEEQSDVLSRELKNQKIYKDVYMNNTLVDINNLFNDDQKNNIDLPQDDVDVETTDYHEKSYDVNEYLEKAHEIHKNDDATRSLENQEFIDAENQIKKLIADIEEKEQDEDIFSDLRGDNEDTMIGAKMKTDEFDTSVFLSLIEDDDNHHTIDENLLLDHALGDKTVFNLQTEEEKKLDYTFEKILESDKIISHKIKKLPLIIFITMAILLVIVIVIILLK